MGLKALSSEIRDDKERYNERCSVTQAFLLLKEHGDADDLIDFRELLADRSTSGGKGTSGPEFAKIINRRFRQLAIDFELQGDPVNNHRRKGCRCGTL